MPLRSTPGKPPSGKSPLRQAPVKRDRSLASIVAAGVVLIALLGGAIGAYVFSRASYVATSAETLCPVNDPPAEVVALILDMSDRLTEVQLLSVRNHLDRLLKNELPRFAFVEVYTVQEQPSAVAEPVIGLCNPGKGNDLNRIYQNPELARKRWEQDFAAVLSAKLDELMAAPDSARSPIYEAVQAVAVRAFGKPEFDRVPKRLIVVSDLLQNVPEKGGSHYRGVPDFDEFRASAYFSQVRADLRDVHVYLYYMNRSDHKIQGADHIRFWEDYFGAQGAQVMAVERIFGGLMADPIFNERLAPGRETRLDVYLFFAAFCTGLSLYAALKLLEVGQLFQTAAVIATLVAYAVVVARVPRLRMRLDQAGDNAYYLGLLFTLMSMAVALYEFRGAALDDAGAMARSGAEQIIANFGVALGSTIAGIFLRVLLHQMRVDPADVESMTRIELAEASKRVKAHLDQVSGNIALFQGQAGQRMNDVVASAGEGVNKVLSTFATEVGSAMVELLKRTEEAQRDALARTAGTAQKLDAMADSAKAAIDRLKEVAPPPQRLATRLNKVCESLDALAVPIQTITQSLQQAAHEVSRTTQQIGVVAGQLDATVRDNRDQQSVILRSVAEAAEQFRVALGAAGETLRQDKAVLAELEAQARASSAETVRVHEAASRVLQTFTDVTRELTTLVRAGGPPSPVIRVTGQTHER